MTLFCSLEMEHLSTFQTALVASKTMGFDQLSIQLEKAVEEIKFKALGEGFKLKEFFPERKGYSRLFFQGLNTRRSLFRKERELIKVVFKGEKVFVEVNFTSLKIDFECEISVGKNFYRCRGEDCEEVFQSLEEYRKEYHEDFSPHELFKEFGKKVEFIIHLVYDFERLCILNGAPFKTGFLFGVLVQSCDNSSCSTSSSECYFH